MPSDNLNPQSTTSQIRHFMLRSATTGQGVTGKTATDFSGKYNINGGTEVTLSFSAGTAGDAYSSGKIVPLGLGKYAWHVPDALYASVGSVSAVLACADAIDVHFDWTVAVASRGVAAFGANTVVPPTVAEFELRSLPSAEYSIKTTQDTVALAVTEILEDTEVTIPELIDTLRGADDDTLKTLSDQIDGIAGGAGTGARTVTITITDGTNPLQNATVRMSEGANTYTALTSVSGVAVFNLDDATHVVGVSKSGYTFAGATLLVDKVETVAYAMTAVSVSAPSDPALCAVTIPIVNQHGVALVGEPVEIRFNEFADSATTTTLVLSPPPVQVSDANGRVIVELLRLASYSVFYGADAYKRRVDVDVPDAASFTVGE